MLKNYLKIAIRNLLKYKLFSFLNILGLALGIACSLIILLWVNDEKSIDAFHANSNRLFTVYRRQYYDNKIEGLYATTGHLAEEMKRVIPEVQYAMTLRPASPGTFRVAGKILKEPGCYASAGFFTMFSYPLLQGKTCRKMSPKNMTTSSTFRLS